MKGPFGIAYSPLDTVVKAEGEEQKLWFKELRDLARGLCGALFVALPLLYTEEMWAISRGITAFQYLGLLLLAYLANVGYIMFSGYKPEPERRAAWMDAVVALGLGIVGSAVTLLLIGRYTTETPLIITARVILLEAVPASFGASLAINQLGARGYKRTRPQPADDFSMDVRRIVATTLGALLFSFNIAPTVETRIITMTISEWHTLAIVLFSLFVSYLMVYFADFVERARTDGVLGPIWAETCVAYIVSLLVSAFLLWTFGYLNSSIPLPLAIAWTITLGYVTTLGGSAGRLVL